MSEEVQSVTVCFAWGFGWGSCAGAAADQLHLPLGRQQQKSRCASREGRHVGSREAKGATFSSSARSSHAGASRHCLLLHSAPLGALDAAPVAAPPASACAELRRAGTRCGLREYEVAAGGGADVACLHATLDVGERLFGARPTVDLSTSSTRRSCAASAGRTARESDIY